MVSFKDFYHFGFENYYGDIILVVNVIVDKKGYLGGDFVIDMKVVILLTLLIIVIFVNFNEGCQFFLF